MPEENNTIFKEDIEASFKKEIAIQLQLQLHNDTTIEIMNQRFTSFQTITLQTMKDLVINMVPPFSNQQRSNLLSPPPDAILHTQPPTYQYHDAFIHHPYLLQKKHAPLSLTCLHYHIPTPLLSIYHHNLLKKLHCHQTKFTTTTSVLSDFYQLGTEIQLQKNNTKRETSQA